jgi:hypothetical protein
MPKDGPARDLGPFSGPTARVSLGGMGDSQEIIELLRDLEQIAVETGRPAWAEQLASLRRSREAEHLVPA